MTPSPTNATPEAGRTAIDAFAREILATKRGIGMVPPFYAETASVKDDEEYPFWIVRNKSCNSLGCLMSRGEAILLSEAMNRAAIQSEPK